MASFPIGVPPIHLWATALLLVFSPAAPAQSQCAACHPKIAATYAQTGMGRSFQTPDAALVTAVPFYHKPSDTWHETASRDGKVFQRRWRVDPDGKQLDLRELAIDYIMGSGNHARSFLHRTERGVLIELPLASYAENGGSWWMSPGHDRPYTLPPRSISYECMFCHNAYPGVPPGAEDSFAEPRYLEPLPQGIDCQRCHGSGAEHMAKAQSGGATLDQVRAAIVNPSKLSSERQLEICMQCHLETTALPLPHSLVKYGRGPFSFHPGEPLGDFMLFFDHAPGSKYENDFEIAHSAYRLRKSQCFVKSAGKMTCTTCHNPHDVPRAERATAHYNGVCGSCHMTKPASHPAGSDCIACHMIKRQTQDVIHTAMTDHWIARRPSNVAGPAGERAEFDQNRYRGEVIPYYPAPLPKTPDNDLLLAVAQVNQKSDLARGLPRLALQISQQKPARHEPYIELGQAWLASGKTANAVASFEEALRRKPDSVFATLSLADALSQMGQTARAATLLNRAVEAAPDQPLLWYQLGVAQSKSGNGTAGAESLTKSLMLDPDAAEVHSALASLQVSLGNARDAEGEFHKALVINPDLPDALANLGELLGLQGHLIDATYYLGRATQVTPRAVAPRINYAAALAALGQLGQAQTQIDEALRLDPKLPAAHFISGSILEKTNHPDKALAEIEAAVRLKPDYPAAHMAAARLLAAKGNVAEAQRHLELARRRQ